MSGGLRHYLAADFWTNPVSLVLLRPVQFLTATLIPLLQDLAEWARPRRAEPPAGDWAVGTAHIFPTMVCNARCVFCAYSSKLVSGPVKVMPLELFRKAVDGIAGLGLDRVSLIPMLGEILTDPGIFDKIACARARGLKVSTFTNGILLLNGDNIRRLLDSGVDDLTVSLSDLDPEVEAANYRIPVETARRKMEGVARLLELNAAERKVKTLCLSFRPSRNPYRITRHPFFRRIRELGADYSFLLKLDNWGGSVKQENLRGIMRLVRPRRVRRRPCYALRSFSIHPDGNVRLCGCRVGDTLNDDLVMGNLHEQPLREILWSPKSAALRRRYFGGSLPGVCENCGYFGPE